MQSYNNYQDNLHFNFSDAKSEDNDLKSDYSNIFLFQDSSVENEKQKFHFNKTNFQEIYFHDMNMNSEELPPENQLQFLSSQSNSIINEGLYDKIEKNNFLNKKRLLQNDQKITFKKNRNNSYESLFVVSNDKENNNETVQNNIPSDESTSTNNKPKIEIEIPNNPKRCDSILIKFKSFLGKSFIQYLNDKLKKITKRRIKFYAFNYQKFTLNVSYEENKKWLNEKVKNLLVFGEENNQIKNEKSLSILYNKKGEEFEEIKKLMEISYKELIEKFYESEYFAKFKEDSKVIQMNDFFVSVMNISILQKNGFIDFMNTRRGNKKILKK